LALRGGRPSADEVITGANSGPVGERTADLERVAEIAQEHTHPDGDIIGAEGELGEEMHILLDGTVRVVRGEARRSQRGAERSSARCP
jgi:CRP-like cAMP-binding protein